MSVLERKLFSRGGAVRGYSNGGAVFYGVGPNRSVEEVANAITPVHVNRQRDASGMMVPYGRSMAEGQTRLQDITANNPNIVGYSGPLPEDDDSGSEFSSGQLQAIEDYSTVGTGSLWDPVAQEDVAEYPEGLFRDDYGDLGRGISAEGSDERTPSVEDRALEYAQRAEQLGEGLELDLLSSGVMSLLDEEDATTAEAAINAEVPRTTQNQDKQAQQEILEAAHDPEALKNKIAEKASDKSGGAVNPDQVGAVIDETSDKYRALGGDPSTFLLDFGLALMASKSPYFMTAVGEAGLVARKSAKERLKSKREDKKLKEGNELAEIKLEIEKVKLEREKTKSLGEGYDPKSPLGKKFYDFRSALHHDRMVDAKFMWKDIINDVTGGDDSPYAKIDPDKYSTESLKTFSETGNFYDLRSKSSNEKISSMIGNIPVNEVTGPSLDKFIGTGKYADLKWVETKDEETLSELHKKIQTRNKYCGVDPNSSDCATAKSDIETYTARTQKLVDDPLSRANDLRKERKKAIEGVQSNINIGKQIKRLLTDNYSTFKTGQAEALPRLMDNLIETATHSYRSVTDWKALGDLIDRAQSYATQMTSGKPDEDTWRAYHLVVDDINNFNENAINNVNQYYQDTTNVLFDDDHHKDIVFGGSGKMLDPNVTEMIRAKRIEGKSDDEIRNEMIQGGASPAAANRYLRGVY